jgi:hypothetical protein
MISLGFIFEIIFTILWVLGCLVLIAIGKHLEKSSDWDGETDYIILLKWGGRTALLIGILFAAWTFFPYNMDYHSYKPVEGNVSNVANRLITAGDKGGTNQKFVVTFQGSNQPYGCEDTRCALIKKGEPLKLNCIKVWQYASVPGYDCRYNQ